MLGKTWTNPWALVPVLALSSGLLFGAGASHQAEVEPGVVEELARNGRAEVLVVFAEKADLRAAGAQPTRRARGRFVYEALTQVARRSQGGLRALLDARKISYRAHYLGNMIRLEVDRQLLDQIARRPEVARIERNPEVQALDPMPAGEPEAVSTIEWNLTEVGAPTLWAGGYKGGGAVVATADTGVAWEHPALKPHYRGWDGISADHAYNWHDAIAGQAAPLDQHGHGTHVTGIMIGDDNAGNQIGVAPEAQWIGCRNMNASGIGSPSSYTECFEFFVAPYPAGGDPMVDGLPGMAPDVINNSWTCPASESCSWNTLRRIVEQVRAAGILVVSAAGNGGSAGCSSISQPPAIYDASLSVGATSSNDSIASFSSRGPVVVDASGRLKPDLAAPGVGVRSSLPGGTYASFNGTSMAAPHVAGVTALLLSANPALSGLPDRLEAVLLAGARPMTAVVECGGESPGVVPNNTFGTGILFAPDSLTADPFDLDTLPFGSDNCPDYTNEDQADGDADGTGDACDCAPDDETLTNVPGEAGPRLNWNTSGTLLSWLAALDADSHDVYETLVQAGMAPSLACQQASLPGTSASLAPALVSGEVRGYVIAGRNGCGIGTVGASSGGSPRLVSTLCP